MRTARIIGGVGRLLIWAGAIVLLFVAYQLWGTSIAEARAQNDLEDEFEELVAEFDVRATTTTTEPDASASTSSSTTTSTSTTTSSTLPPPPPDDGEAVARIVIPRIGVDKIVVEGVGRSDLQRGPGHYPTTPMPGQPGNAAIAGHRTTYGQPFFDVDKLEPGDDIFVTTLQGVFRYVVSGTEIVAPTRVDVVEDQGDDRLTLTSCHPKFSAAQRIIVTALLADEAAPATTTTTTLPEPTEGEDTDGDEDVAAPATGPAQGPPSATELQSLDGDAERRAGPALLWGSITLGVWLAFYALSKTWRRIPAYVLGAPVFALTLFVFFGALSELLPANY